MEETLGKRISCNRKRLGLTQEKLAELLGVTAQAVSKWENDQSCPDISMLPMLAKIFAITTDKLLGLSPGAPPEECAAQECCPTPLAEPPVQERSLRDILGSPSAGFAFWLFLTGSVAAIQVYQPIQCSLTDIAIACGVCSFGLCSFIRRFSLLGLGCAVAGLAFVANLIAEPRLADIDWTLPLAAGLALLGLDLLIQTIRGQKNFFTSMPEGHLSTARRNAFACDDTQFQSSVCFASDDRMIQLPLLTGGAADVTFGELIVDLTHCGQIADKAQLSLSCTFGAMKLLIPRQYRVELITNSTFGAVDVKGAPEKAAASTLYLTCDVRFGAVTIRHI